MKNYHEYLRPEELDWFWEYDTKTRSHKLTLTHKSTNQSVNGSFVEVRGQPSRVTQKKRELYQSLTEQLEKLIF